MGPRTLQRRLSDEGTSWRDELERFRQQRVEHLLRETSMTLEAISARSGYSDPRALRRAVHRWYGRGPDVVTGRTGRLNLTRSVRWATSAVLPAALTALLPSQVWTNDMTSLRPGPVRGSGWGWRWSSTRSSPDRRSVPSTWTRPSTTSPATPAYG
ncbi:AraC family transcriptional regulator [Actinomadura soli]|uniref:AraC family transcriptional regulator n=1 Tax=Actinomadura soli TaxID=2508997 RepID=A0A5C4JDX5_9ACTN|nr:AraC family transcriptional regulator [Actinomadura soli]